MDYDSTLKVVVLEDSINEIEVIISRLRNAGIAVRSYNADSEDDFNDLIAAQALDLVMCHVNEEDPGLVQIIEIIKRAGKDIAVIGIDDQYDIEKASSIMDYGVRDYVSKQNPEHIAQVVKREFKDLNIRRKLRSQDKAMRETEKRCHTLLDSSRDAITYVHEGMHIYANPVYLEKFGFTDRDEIDGIPIMDMVAPEDHGKFKEFLKRYSKGEDQTDTLEVKGQQPDGKIFNAIMEFSPASIEGEPCTQIIIRVQTHDKDLENKLKHLTTQDVLTGLYNRQYFLEELSQAVSEATAGSQSSALLYIEPDNFRDIKEAVGISGTDLILGDLGAIIKDITPDNSISARFGDATFAVLFKGSNQSEIQKLAELIRDKIEHHIADIGERSMTLTASIGINFIGETAVSSQDVISKADLACEMMHKEGGNKIHTHNPIADLQASKDRDQYWGHMIRDALSTDKFKLVYQPIASLLGETGERYEVLLRLYDQENKEHLPGKFIPVAEQSELIVKIDRWVITQAIKALSERRSGGHDTLLFVKISARTLTDETLLPWISALLKKSRLPGNALVFELSEPNAVTHLKFAKIFAQGLKQLHCGFCLEDFGNGMNSFQLLKHLPVDYLKIDGSFIHNLTSDNENQSMVKSIVEMASSLNKPVIAEFVEDANSLSILWQSGIQFIQGHFLQKPEANMNFDFSGESEEENNMF